MMPDNIQTEDDNIIAQPNKPQPLQNGRYPNKRIVPTKMKPHSKDAHTNQKRKKKKKLQENLSSSEYTSISKNEINLHVSNFFIEWLSVSLLIQFNSAPPLAFASLLFLSILGFSLPSNCSHHSCLNHS